MTAYLTPERFKTMRTGASVTGIPDVELVQVLEEATGVVDSYCTVPLMPQPHSFLGGSIVDEMSAFKFPEHPMVRGQRRIYPRHWPVIEFSSLEILVSESAAAPIPVGSIVVNNSERWAEIVALTITNTSGLFGVSGWVVPLGGLIVPQARYSYTYGWVFAEVDERVYQVAEGSKTYQASHGFWVDPDADREVKVDDVLIDDDDYTVDALEGRITFDDDQTGTVTVTYSHRLPREIPQAMALITAYLLGESKLRAKGMTGIERMRVNEIEISRPRLTGSALAQNLDQLVPAAALMLSGFKFWTWG